MADAGPKNWIEVEENVEKACEEMHLGELLHGLEFNYFTSSFALEVMDERMDAGLNSELHLSMEEMINNDHAPFDLTFLELIDTIDHFFRLETSWFTGGTLSTTVFASLFVLRLDRIAANPLLHAYCKAMKISCGHIRNIICLGDAREEEDFVTNSFGLPMETDLSLEAFSAIDSMELKLEKKLHIIKSEFQLKSEEWVSNGVCSKEEENAEKKRLLLKEEIILALLKRFRFRKYFFNALERLRKFSGQSLETSKALLISAKSEIMEIRNDQFVTNRTDMNEFSEQKKIQRMKLNVDKDLALSSQASGLNGALLLAAMELNTLDFLEPSQTEPVHPGNYNSSFGCESNGNIEDSPSLSDWLAIRHPVGFAPTVNRGLLSSGAVRPISWLSFEESLQALEKLISDLIPLCDFPIHFPLTEVQNLIVAYSRVHIPGPISRCQMQLLVLSDNKLFGVEKISDSILRDLRMPSSDPLLLSDWTVESFLKNAARLEQKYLKILCENPSRQRRNLLKILSQFGDFQNKVESRGQRDYLREYAEKTFGKSDRWWPQHIFSSWASEKCCRIVLQSFLLGFQTELYEARELCPVFWYLDHVLTTLQFNIEAKEGSFLIMEKLQTGQSQVKDKKAKRKKSSQVSTDAMLRDFKPSFDLLLTKCYKNMCRALTRLLLLFIKEGRLSFGQSHFSTEREQFEQRFSVFDRSAVPEPLDYNAYLRGVDFGDLKAEDVYQSAYNYFDEVKLDLLAMREALSRDRNLISTVPWLAAEHSEEVKRLSQVSLRNSTALKVAHNGGPQLKAGLDFSFHGYFPVIILKRG